MAQRNGGKAAKETPPPLQFAPAKQTLAVPKIFCGITPPNILTAAPNLARCFAHWARFASFAPQGDKTLHRKIAISNPYRRRSGSATVFYLHFSLGYILI